MTEQEIRRAKLQQLVDDFHGDKYGDYADSFVEFAATYGLTWGDSDDEVDTTDPDGFEPIPRYVSMMSDETYNMLACHDTLKGALNRMAASAGEEYLGNAGPLWDLDAMEVEKDGGRTTRYNHTTGMIDFGTVMMTTEMLKLLPELIDDAIQYRRSDDNDEDGNNDNKQADMYRKILSLFTDDN